MHEREVYAVALAPFVTVSSGRGKKRNYDALIALARKMEMCIQNLLEEKNRRELELADLCRQLDELGLEMEHGCHYDRDSGENTSSVL